ncbi:ABC transporter ATP-binding protein [Falsiroseomonas sp. CW058]|uniref:ABC transporter ATP-binding protein n=1 Tax=Falsiroseomonas sp. CW058 TaxID=3388664 RepID=UPI003D310F3E
MNAPLVRFRGVSKTFDGRVSAVASLDLDIMRGEFLTLLGPSGSGKTTTLMMLAGFEDPSAGAIELDGRRIESLPPHRRGIGVVFQNYALFPHMTVARNLAFPLSVRGVPRREVAERVDAALALVRLPGFGERRPAELSGGQQQRVALARALIFRPELVLMDEPLGALDKQLREELQMEIRHLHRQLGVTVVYVTHDQSEALTMSDRIAVFDAGRIRQLGTPAEVYEAPADAFVAGFVGENNRLHGVVEEPGAETSRVRLPDGTRLLAAPCGLPAGRPVVLSLRPERIAIGPAAAGLANQAEARLEEVVYLGDHSRLRLAFAGRDDLLAKLPRQEGALVPQPGQALRIGFPAAALRAFPD